jgi:pSer/pThr/pTyr-binding forkhead associated (FHA) protein
VSALILRSADPHLACGDFLLKQGVWIIGRSAESDLVVDHPTVSRRHARVAVTNTRARVSDLGSTNGSYLDGKRIRKSVVIADGHELRFGGAVFLVVTRSPPERLESESEISTAPCDAEPAEANVTKLSSAQHRVLVQLLKGVSEKEIAATLNLSAHTVHSHVKAIHVSFGTHSRSELMGLFISKVTAT